MAARKSKRWRSAFAVGVLIGGLLLAGCAGSKIKGESDPNAATLKDQGPVPLYYDFGDVLVPSELELDKNGSFVFRTPGFSAGVLSLKGRVEINSLIGFFDTNMSRDNWQLVSSFKSQRTIMLFHKDNRWCVINITEKGFYTYTEIWVSPTTTEKAPSGLLK